MKQESPLVARLVLGAVALMVLAIPVGINLKESHDLEVLRRSSHPTYATVTRKWCENHYQLGYSYTVDGRKYSGTGSLPGNVCATVELGQEIPIIYAAEHPQFSKSIPIDVSEGYVSGNFFALGLLSLAAIVLVFRVTRLDVDRSSVVKHRSFRLTRKKR